jgi:VWFA-related protein
MGFWRRIVSLSLAAWGAAVAVAQVPAPQPDVLHVTTQLVVLDATVLDKEGHIVTQALSRDDFLIEENKKPQAVYSFESTGEHTAAAASGDKEKSPELIFVLDELNYSYDAGNSLSWNIMEQFNQYTYERTELLGYLRTQPEKLQEETEVLVLTHHGYRILVQPTRDRAVLLERVGKHDPGLGSPQHDFIEETGGISISRGARDFTLTKDSLQAIWSLALQQRSLPGRKLVIWLGRGAPTLPVPVQRHEDVLSGPAIERLPPALRYQHEITDLLVDARITLDLIGPGGGGAPMNPSVVSQQVDSYLFDSDFGFSGYISATGGQRKNGNDVRGEIQASIEHGTMYYTMSYRPMNHDFDGEFRRIRVTVKGHPEWTVLTKAGYYAMQYGGETDLEHQALSDLGIVTFEAMPFSAIGAALVKIERIKGTDKARFTFQLDSDDLQWHTDSTANVRQADVAVSVAALGSVFKTQALASQGGMWKLTVPLATETASIHSSVSITVSVPPKTQRLRFAVRDLTNGRMGTVDLNPAALASAPEMEAPTPVLQPRGAAQAR